MNQWWHLVFIRCHRLSSSLLHFPIYLFRRKCHLCHELFLPVTKKLIFNVYFWTRYALHWWLHEQNCYVVKGKGWCGLCSRRVIAWTVLLLVNDLIRYMLWLRTVLLLANDSVCYMRWLRTVLLLSNDLICLDCNSELIEITEQSRHHSEILPAAVQLRWHEQTPSRDRSNVDNWIMSVRQYS